MPLLQIDRDQAIPYEPIQPVRAPSGTFPTVLASQLGVQVPQEDAPRSRRAQAPALKSYQSVAHEGEGERKPALRARDLMTRSVHTLPADATLLQAKELMERYRIRHLPIVEGSGQGSLIGMISDRDILRGILQLDGPVSAQMSRQVLSATAETPIPEIAQALLSNRIHSLPVVGADRGLVGILTTTDILRALVRRAPIELWA